jgi:glycosyltransferase EpsF
VFRAMNVGGAETMILNLYRSMDREQIQFDFLVHTDEIGYYENEITNLGGRIFRLPEPKLLGIRTYQKDLYKLLKQNQFCAIHSHTHFFSGFILEVAKKVPIPVRAAHSHTTSHGRKETIVRRIYLAYMKSAILKNATHRFGCSEAACDSLFGKAVAAVVIPNSFDLEKYEQLSNGNIQATSPPIIGHIGRFDKVKNHLFFLETFHHFKKEFPETTAILIGDGPERENIVDAIAKYKLTDSVKLLGIRSDIPEILDTMDLFLFPSLYEGLGNVIIEAQAAGINCLVSDTVPKEVDLSMNLVTFKNLQDGAKEWAETLVDIMNRKERPSWTVRKQHLKEHGYDLKENVNYLEKVYNGL